MIVGSSANEGFGNAYRMVNRGKCCGSERHRIRQEMNSIRGRLVVQPNVFYTHLI